METGGVKSNFVSFSLTIGSFKFILRRLKNALFYYAYYNIQVMQCNGQVFWNMDKWTG